MKPPTRLQTANLPAAEHRLWLAVKRLDILDALGALHALRDEDDLPARIELASAIEACRDADGKAWCEPPTNLCPSCLRLTENDKFGQCAYCSAPRPFRALP